MTRPRTSRRLITLIVAQLGCLAVLLALGRASSAPLVLFAVLPAVLALSVLTMGPRSLGSWVLARLALRRRRRLAVAVSRSFASGHGVRPANPLAVLDPDVELGAVAMFRRRELGVLQTGRSWVAALWVTGGPRADDPRSPDGVTALLALPASETPGVHLSAVFQQVAGTRGRSGPQITAWLSIRVDPLVALPPGRALTAVPAMIRSELRRLQRCTADGVLSLVPLDRSDLLTTLATSTELPAVPQPGMVDTTDETWHLWQARGRFHHSFVLDPGTARPLAFLVGLAMEVAAGDRDAVLTVRLPCNGGRTAHRAQRGDDVDLPAVRISHRDPDLLLALADQVMDMLEQEGAATRPMSGEQGPGVLDTSILAGARPR